MIQFIYNLFIYNLIPMNYLLLITSMHNLQSSKLSLTSYSLPLTTYYLLPTTYYLLPTTYYLLPTNLFPRCQCIVEIRHHRSLQTDLEQCPVTAVLTEDGLHWVNR